MRCASVTTLSMSGLAALSGCSGVQSALETHGDNADAIARLIWIFTAVAAVVWVAVMVALAIALLRRRRIVSPDPLAPRNDAPAVPIVTGAAVLTTLVIAALTAFSYFTDKSLASIPTNDAVHIRVTGHQWWWEVRYESPQPSRTLIVANEIHVPVGRPVQLNLQSTDVIHSFWVPSLAGKEDLIPGHENLLAFTAERAGIYRGQCAEFCGLQHAHMGVVVVAEPEADFDEWLDAQLAPAADPTDDEAMRGRSAFLSAPCINCHSIRGTPAGGHVAPDLTHLASRLSLAADTLAMSRGNLAAWIADPQGIKPGANMPRTDLKPDDLNAIVAYLSALK